MLNDFKSPPRRKFRHHPRGQIFLEFMIVLALMVIVLVEVEFLLSKSKKEIKKTEVTNEVRRTNPTQN